MKSELTSARNGVNTKSSEEKKEVIKSAQYDKEVQRRLSSVREMESRSTGADTVTSSVINHGSSCQCC